MTPRRQLAKIYTEQANLNPNPEHRRHLIEKAAFWLGIADEAEAKPPAPPETPIF